MFADDLDWYFFNAMTTSGPERFFASSLIFALPNRENGRDTKFKHTCCTLAEWNAPRIRRFTTKNKFTTIVTMCVSRTTCELWEFSAASLVELMALLQNYHLSSLVSRWENYFGRDQGFFLPGKEEISSFQDRVRKKAAIFVVVAIGNGSRDQEEATTLSQLSQSNPDF